MKITIFLSLFLLMTCAAFGQSTEFTYQGKLNDGAVAANANYDFEFRLFDSVASGTQIGPLVTRTNVPVLSGVFGVQLDFGGFFPGADRFLEVRVRIAGSASYTALTPRQRINSSPYGIKSLVAETANNANNLGGVAANQYVVTGDARLSDARSPLANSANYIQNTTITQAATDFNISGTGTANILRAAIQFNIGASRVLSMAGSFNLFAGSSAGGGSNTGTFNSFFGTGAGRLNTTGQHNSFFGAATAYANTEGSHNVFVGSNAGQANTVGSSNAFVGRNAGYANTIGGSNSFFGPSTGQGNTSGNNNTFLGGGAGSETTTGSNNTMVGNVAGVGNMTGSNNTLIGQDSQITPDLNFATAIGSMAVVSSSNTIALGRGNGTDKVVIYGLGAAGATTLCRNTLSQVATCSSSLRYKTDIKRFNFGLNLVNRLHPITFSWKDGGMTDLGLGAEDVAAIEPLLVTFNKDGQVEGVKYDRIGVVLVNAVKEQQAQIERQQSQIDALTKLVCVSNASASVCTEKR